jgi:septal ring factor EnvC (AmiA/AmiB activator)
VKVAELIEQEGISDGETRRILRRFKEFAVLEDKINRAQTELQQLYDDILRAQKGVQSFDQEIIRLNGVIERLKNQESELIKKLNRLERSWGSKQSLGKASQ